MTEINGTGKRLSKQNVLSTIREFAVIPVLRVDSRDQALCAVEGVVLAGYPLIEITLTIPNAINLIAELVEHYKEKLIVGAGTVIDTDMCSAAISAGAGFIVSPSTDPEVIRVVRERQVVCIPGAQTPTEVITAWKAGADLVKIFPAGLSGGPAYIRALKGPFPQVEFVPSNGVDLSNAAEYIAAGSTAVSLGGLIFESRALLNGESKVIAANATRFIEHFRSAVKEKEAARLEKV
jgi:2-dehydro-3-deoxyphosphogluconate aldolase/(4S)-4-hydroxy-2-oxoglutarate aldolase